MRFSLTALLLAATLSTTTLATPLPSDFNGIERRWSEGQSEVCALSNQSGCYILAWVQAMAQIHAIHNPRPPPTPSWPIVCDGSEEASMMDPDAFEATTDERTMLERSRNRSRFQKRGDAGLTAKMRQFVTDFMRSKGETGMIGARRVESVADVEEAPVLKPRKGMRYRWSA
ncbi:hypothetical protein LTR36_001805 [Oleoguttula mirabilis]|uniref:Uncharacterized protein n=1 Tax=Oleoguttula mirabilis TaxID=1507867 RepID=A0AAV9JM35_9PEZI|nr:hypothetical protein LTR36_001805 [Oleoguttula mirabilis]